MEISALPPSSHAGEIEAKRAQLTEVAVALEASFLTEMLKHSGHGEARDSFGGGAGEDAFSGFLAREQAGLLAAGGGIGLAEHIVESLMKREENAG